MRIPLLKLVHGGPDTGKSTNVRHLLNVVFLSKFSMCNDEEAQKLEVKSNFLITSQCNDGLDCLLARSWCFPILTQMEKATRCETHEWSGCRERRVPSSNTKLSRVF